MAKQQPTSYSPLNPTEESTKPSNAARKYPDVPLYRATADAKELLASLHSHGCWGQGSGAGAQVLGLTVEFTRRFAHELLQKICKLHTKSFGTACTMLVFNGTSHYE